MREREIRDVAEELFKLADYYGTDQDYWDYDETIDTIVALLCEKFGVQSQL